MARWASGAVLLGGLGAAGAGVVGACLPDLAPNLCGNGHIDSHETCDPGGFNPDPYCTAQCQIVCGADAGAAFLDFAFSNHCYFTTFTPQRFDDGVTTCRSQRAHVVTLVDDDEAKDMAGSFPWPDGARYWVGLDRPDASVDYASQAANEPGWAPPASCPGCFAHSVTTSSLPAVDGGAEAGAANCVVTAGLDSNAGTTEGIGCNAASDVICEREPVGSRSIPCAGTSFCFDIAATLNAKAYVYNPIAMAADDAESYCQTFTDAGKGSLVVFESRAEREQVIYELSQLTSLLRGGGPMPSQFWIGLYGTSSGTGASRPIAWTWDNGMKPGSTSYTTGSPPAIWGNGQPDIAEGVSGKLYAFIQLASTYDTGLAYARADPKSLLSFPFVCQY